MRLHLNARLPQNIRLLYIQALDNLVPTCSPNPKYALVVLETASASSQSTCAALKIPLP